MFPKATDDTFLSKLYENHHGKSASFDKPRKQQQKQTKSMPHETHFEVSHYAGTVGYNIDGWLSKNKDPINDSLIDTLSASKEPLVAQLFTESKGMSNVVGFLFAKRVSRDVTMINKRQPTVLM